MMNHTAAQSKHEYQKWDMMNAKLPWRPELLLTERTWQVDFTDRLDNWHYPKTRQKPDESSGSQAAMSELSPFWYSFMFTNWYPVTIPSCPKGLDFQGIKYNETFMIMNKNIYCAGYEQTRNIPTFYSSTIIQHIRKRPTSICYRKQFVAILAMCVINAARRA